MCSPLEHNYKQAVKQLTALTKKYKELQKENEQLKNEIAQLKKGDLNQDGNVDLKDVLILRKKTMGME